MRKRIKTKKFGRVSKQRKALVKSLLNSMIEKENMNITLVKAKMLRTQLEKIVTKAKVDTLTSRRLVRKLIGVVNIKKLFDQIAPRYGARWGGYTRITKLGPRQKDGIEMARIELIN